MPRSLMTMVTWCSASGREVQKSQLFFALRRLVHGSRLTAWLRSGNVSGSRRKNTGVLLPTRSHVAFLGVELERESANVALGARGAARAGHGGKAQEKIGLLAHLGKDSRASVAGDVVGGREGAEGAGALGVHAPLRDHFAVEVGEFLEEPDVLKQHRAPRPRGHHILVVDDRRASGGGQIFFIFHFRFPSQYWVWFG